ncbi:MAG: lipopolysaccharide biosynthesis protein [Candidatus Electrothrix sp. YB6]
MTKRIKQFIQRLLPENSFARSVSVLIGGTAGAQLLTVLAAPLLTRLYSPEDLGLLAVFIGLLALINVVSCLRYELAIPLPEVDQEAANLAVLCLILIVVTSFVTSMLVFFLGDPIAQVLAVPQLAGYFWLLPIGVLFGGAYNVFNYWGIRTKRFNIIAATRLRQSITSLAIQLTAFKLGGIALLLGYVAGQGVGTSSLAAPVLTKPEFKQASTESVKKVAIRYRHFPYFATWGGLLNTAGMQLPSLLFAFFFGPAVAGIYALAHRVISLPMFIVGQAIGNVFLSKAGEAKREGNLAPLVAEVHERLAQLAMPPVLIIAAIGPDLFAWVFGNEWREAGEFARLLTPMLYFQFVLSPIATLFSVLEKQKESMILQAIMLIIRCTSILMASLLNNIRLAIFLFSIGSSLCYIVFLIRVVMMSKNSLYTVFRATFRAACFGVFWTGPLLIFIIYLNS